MVSSFDNNFAISFPLDKEKYNSSTSTIDQYLIFSTGSWHAEVQLCIERLQVSMLQIQKSILGTYP